MTETGKIFNEHKNYYEKIVIGNTICSESLFIFKQYNRYSDCIECLLIKTSGIQGDSPSCIVKSAKINTLDIYFRTPTFDVDIDETVNYIMDRFNDSLNDVIRGIINNEHNISENSKSTETA